MKIINRLLVILLTLVCVAMLGGCSVVNNSSKFDATEVELGMSRDEIVGRFGQPYNKEMSQLMLDQCANFLLGSSSIDETIDSLITQGTQLMKDKGAE